MTSHGKVPSRGARRPRTPPPGRACDFGGTVASRKARIVTEEDGGNSCHMRPTGCQEGFAEAFRSDPLSLSAQWLSRSAVPPGLSQPFPGPKEKTQRRRGRLRSHPPSFLPLLLPGLPHPTAMWNPTSCLRYSQGKEGRLGPMCIPSMQHLLRLSVL